MEASSRHNNIIVDAAPGGRHIVIIITHLFEICRGQLRSTGALVAGESAIALNRARKEGGRSL
jgi:hypothetical protein